MRAAFPAAALTGLLWSITSAQSWRCGPEITLAPPVRWEVDKLGQLVLYNNKEIIKITTADTLFNRFSQMSLGPIHALDVTNPMKILVFYKDAGRIVFLDNTLSPNGQIVDLIALGYDQAELACTSFDNGLWIYDRLNFRLLRFNNNMQITVEVPNLNLVLGGRANDSLSFCRLSENNNRVYIQSNSGEVLVFDVYGTLVTRLHCPVPCQCRTDESGLRYVLEGRQYLQSLRSGTPALVVAENKNFPSAILDWLNPKRVLYRTEEGKYRVCRID